MEVGSLQHLGDSFSSYRWLKHASAKTPSFKRLVDVDGDVGGGGSSRYFIDMDPADLFSMRWTAPDGSELNFDFDLPAGVGDDDDSTIFPLLVSASKIFHDGRLLPHELMITDDDGDVRRRVSGSTSPVFHSAQSTPASLSSSSSARSKQNAAATTTTPPLLAAGKSSSSSSSPWKILLRYLRFLMPIYRKVRALPTTATRKRRVSPAASSAAVSARASTSSIDWCHGIADTAVHDAILYCKKSSGQNI